MWFQYSIRDLLTVTMFAAFGFLALQWTPAPPYNYISILLPMASGVAFGAAIGVVTRNKFGFACAGAFAVPLTLNMMFG